MSGAKETPRQKMIGMMYLVYTALLAMNVSADILDAFAIVADGQQRTNGSITRKINNQYQAFDDQLAMDSIKTHIYWEAAQEIRAKTDTIVNFIEKDILFPMACLTEKKTPDELMNPKDPEKPYLKFKDRLDLNARRVVFSFNVSNFDAKDNFEAPMNLMINQGKATMLKEKINDYRTWLLAKMESVGIKDYDSKVSLMTDKRRDGTPITFYNANREPISWEEKNFAHIVFAAEVAILNQFVGDIQTAEFDAVSTLMGSIGANDYKFNSLQARVVPKSDYITQGQDFEADVFIAALDTEREFDVRYAKGIEKFDVEKHQGTVLQSQNGVVKLRIPGNSTGEQKLAGVIEMKNPETGAIEYHEFNTSFMVAPPSATIAPTKMMVMYSGLENPVAVSAPGYKPQDIRVEVVGGAIVKSDKAKGEYLIKVNGDAKEVHVKAFGMKDNKSVPLRDELFRVKPLPKPEATIGGISEGKLSSAKMFAAGKIVAEMKDFDFDGINYEIISYDVNTVINKERKTIGTVKGGDFSSDLVKYINNAKKGQEFNFNEIKAKGPDGKTKPLSPIRIVIE